MPLIFFAKNYHHPRRARMWSGSGADVVLKTHQLILNPSVLRDTYKSNQYEKVICIFTVLRLIVYGCLFFPRPFW